jgi:hypothetical protein
MSGKAFMHRQNGTSGSDRGATRLRPDCLSGTPRSSILDGNIVGTSTSRVPNTPMHWVLQCETELNSTYPAPSAVANVHVDYARVGKYVQ